MEVAMTMHICQRLQCLIDDIPYLNMRNGLPFLHELEDIVRHILKYKIELVVVLDELMEPNDVRMMQLR